MLRAFEFGVRVLMGRLRISTVRMFLCVIVRMLMGRIRVSAGGMFLGVIMRVLVGVAVFVRVDQLTVPVLVAVAVLMGMTVAIDMPMGVAAVVIVHRKRFLNRFTVPRAVENAM
jgi:hypothetical protein